MKDTLQQGHADGMCGLYAILNFLTRVPDGDWSASSNTLWYLLDACRHFGWLTPYTLTSGFEDYQLKAILDLQLETYRMSFATYHLNEIEAAPRLGSFYKTASRVVAAGGSIIASATRRNHWLLITKEGKEITVVDSANPDQPSQTLVTTTKSFSSTWGIVILPQSRSKTKINI